MHSVQSPLHKLNSNQFHNTSLATPLPWASRTTATAVPSAAFAALGCLHCTVQFSTHDSKQDSKRHTWRSCRRHSKFISTCFTFFSTCFERNLNFEFQADLLPRPRCLCLDSSQVHGSAHSIEPQHNNNNTVTPFPCLLFRRSAMSTARGTQERSGQ